MTLCTNCMAGCCRRYDVGLTGYDIIKISRTLDVPPSFFLNVAEYTDEDYIQNVSKSEALFAFTDNSCKHLYRIKLKRVKSTIYETSLKCIFLQEWISEDITKSVFARCGIYNIRPVICSTYPAKFVNDKRTVVIPYVFDRDKNYKESPYELCKRAFIESDFNFDKDEMINLLIKHNYETEFFKSFAEKWNQNPSSVNDFLLEITNLYKNRVYIETEKDNISFISDIA
ncbi:MAG: YkgJ family cysteine cluster protein [Cyanobacteriota bacterium]